MCVSCSVVSNSATPSTAAYQAPLSVGFSRQEYWSGWPFPSPGDLPDPGTEPVCLASPAPTGGLFTTATSGKPDFRILKRVAISFSRGSSQPRNRTQASHIAGRFLTSRATREPKNTGVGSLSLLQWIFPTQESNQGLPYCRQILYRLNCQGSPLQAQRHLNDAYKIRE